MCCCWCPHLGVCPPSQISNDEGGGGGKWNVYVTRRTCKKKRYTRLMTPDTCAFCEDFIRYRLLVMFIALTNMLDYSLYLFDMVLRLWEIKITCGWSWNDYLPLYWVEKEHTLFHVGLLHQGTLGPSSDASKELRHWFYLALHRLHYQNWSKAVLFHVGISAAQDYLLTPKTSGGGDHSSWQFCRSTHFLFSVERVL